MSVRHVIYNFLTKSQVFLNTMFMGRYFTKNNNQKEKEKKYVFSSLCIL